MALRDVKKYYYSMLGQYVDLKADLKDFDQALKDGYITEDRMAEVKEELAKIKENSDRIAYIMYLLELPNRSKKKAKFVKQTADVTDYFSTLNADEAAVYEENKCITAKIREQMKQFAEENGKQ